MATSSSGSRSGWLLGATAYLLWGSFPLYWPLLEPAGAIEILSHRIVWSVVTMGVLVVGLGRRAQLRAIVADRRRALLLAFAAVAVSVNWATYIYGVDHHRVVETSLGYFINPLVTVGLGVVVLGERLRGLQWAALGLGAAAVVVLAVDYGHPPWIALVLACSFGGYGLAKKQADVGAIESLAYETSVVAPLALGYLVWLGAAGRSHFMSEGPGHTLLFMSAGVVTAVPLICFGAAATRLPLVSLGLLQYLAPILQFGLGVGVLGEAMPPGRWIGFALVWLAVALFSADGVRHQRRPQRAATAPATSAA